MPRSYFKQKHVFRTHSANLGYVRSSFIFYTIDLRVLCFYILCYKRDAREISILIYTADIFNVYIILREHAGVFQKMIAYLSF